MSGLPKKIGVIILNWNQAADTIECLRSVYKSRNAELFVVLVDNGSSDGSAEVIGKEFPDLRIIRNGANLGFAGGCNVGIREALEKGADCLFLLNNDTVIGPETIEKLAGFLWSDPLIGIASPKIYYQAEPDRIWQIGVRARLSEANRVFRGTVLPVVGASEVDRGQYEEPLELDAVPGCAMMVRAKVARDIGSLDEDFFLQREETDWCLRARKAGYKVLYYPGSSLLHKVSRATGGEDSPLIAYYSTRNELLLLKKHARIGLGFHLHNLFFVARNLAKALVLQRKRAYALSAIRGAFDYYLGRFGMGFSKGQ